MHIPSSAYYGNNCYHIIGVRFVQ
ncbi:unnamed protein product [Acanthoscelides obtectus]|uniref:Uncharacterized protein n=1 Tax=Acanthoscelides obtectus TaxID=200917 RepID=A0A9P0LGK0_ACAOB|nr:unnamed protein product [Acanthoscelides obtectus]CAK1686246.1 hypothetical protein AOBTE_LOCUS35871 [Acanthoscelides obtectus]